MVLENFWSNRLTGKGRGSSMIQGKKTREIIQSLECEGR